MRSPTSCITPGTSTPRTNVASTTIATPQPIPHHQSEDSEQRQRVQNYRLQRDKDAAREDEKHDGAGDDHDADRDRQAGTDQVLF